MRAKHLVIAATLAGALAAVSLAATILVGAWRTESASPTAAAYAARGAPNVKAAYTEWVKQHDANGGDRYVAISLGYWKALSAAFTRASGMAKLNLIDGSVSVTVSDLPAGDWDVWLVDNRPGPRASIKPDSSDAVINVGRLDRRGDTAGLDAELGPTAFARFHVDLVVVAPAGGDPGATGLLFGAPSLFQRLYTSVRSDGLLRLSDFTGQPGVAVKRSWASLLGARTAQADDIYVNEDVVFSSLVRTGANLFINETFAGNGRTCASCHPISNNTTIDVYSIASLPEDDPLFVAEFTPALAFDPLGPKFEVPVLMRGAGLIVENVDGMDDLVNKFTMRGVPHTLGLRNSLDPAVIPDGTTQPPIQRTGWSGDGAPPPGNLRAFATGAVTQHFPKTLNREPGVDFRLPTDAELDAMEAFQLSLGPQADLVLPLNLKDPRAARGQDLFRTPAPAGGNCNVCHLNGGANFQFDGKNRNFNTGVEKQPDRPAELILKALNIDLTPGVPENILPFDGGFGQTGSHQIGFGNGTFNTPPIAADTGPFFHDNSIDTIEGAVAFYNSQAFNTSPAAQPPFGVNIRLEATQVEAIAAFLRVINALDNIREAMESAAAGRTISFSNPQACTQLLRQAIKDTEDAMGVLIPRGLHPAAVNWLSSAIASFRRASILGLVIDRGQIDKGLSALTQAKADIVQ